MIFVTLGTHYHPFPRALDVVAPLAVDADIIVQHGHTPPRPSLVGWQWMEFLPYERIADLMREAEVVVAHAGVGSLFTALGVGKRPVVLPRLRRLGEHVDDHQLMIGKKLAEDDTILLYKLGDDVRALSRAALDAPAVPTDRSASLKAAVRRAAKAT